MKFPENEIVQKYYNVYDICNMFNNVAKNYDFINHLSTCGIDKKWRKLTVKASGILENKKIIDIATGTADIAIQLARKNPEKVTAVDISEQMLFYAKKKIEKHHLNQKIELIQSDSENLPFHNNTFDVATMGFGIRNCINPVKVLNEINRILKPQGKLIILEFSKPTNKALNLFIKFYLQNFVSFFGKVLSNNKSAYIYLSESINRFPAGNEFLQLMKKANFDDLSVKKITSGIVSIYSGKKII
jgi:demethylmenaquinone methyltransferase/2-methoxy-6-polyprenyl-1,4-benzoquinol methylase